MPESIIIALLGIVGTLLSGVISFMLGRWTERHRGPETFVIFIKE